MADLSYLPRVLVVEDEVLIMMDLQQTLEDAGVAEVMTAATVDEALATLDASRPDAAVLDLHLGRSGWSYDIAHRLQALGVPFVFSSGTTDVVDGFVGVALVGKPYTGEQITGALLELVPDGTVAAAE